VHSLHAEDGFGGCLCIQNYIWDVELRLCVRHEVVKNRPVWLAVVLGTVLAMLAALGFCSIVCAYWSARKPSGSLIAGEYLPSLETANTLSFKPAVGFSEQNFRNSNNGNLNGSNNTNHGPNASLGNSLSALVS
jgi:hypothetical protein